MSDLKVAVIGAGIVGINTALNFVQEISKCQLDIIAENFLENTTSYGPPGIFRPSVTGPSDLITRKWIQDAYRYYTGLRSCKDAGISEVSGYIFSNIDEEMVQNRYLEDVIHVHRKATEEEKHCNGLSWKFGSYFETLTIECPYFLPWAENRLKERGASLIKRKVFSLEDLENYDVLFNCTGLGSKYLCKDSDVIPIRGQLLYVEAPWVNNFFYNDYDTYIIPLMNGKVVLGGCRNFGSYDTSVNQYDIASIKERCEFLQGNLKNAKVLKQWTGLRPYRYRTRVDLEINDSTKVIHNYGHGGCGITIAPGTAAHAVQLFKQAHIQTTTPKCRY